MAIETDNEKLALMSYNQPFNPAVPIVSDGIGQAEKQHLIWQFPGILWQAAEDILLSGLIAINSTMTGSLTVEGWTELSKPAAVWTEIDKPTNAWTEVNKPSGNWIEV